MTRPLSRRRLLRGGEGGAAPAARSVPPASAATDDELAYATFAVASELPLWDLYQKALAAKVVTGPGPAGLRARRKAAMQHARVVRAPHRRRDGRAGCAGLRLPVAGGGIRQPGRDRGEGTGAGLLRTLLGVDRPQS